MAANVMLAIHEKKSTAVDLYRPLRQYIASAYSEREAATADDDRRRLRPLRFTPGLLEPSPALTVSPRFSPTSPCAFRVFVVASPTRTVRRRRRC